MLSGVLLHVIKASLPVNLTLSLRSFQRFFKQMDDLLIFVFKDIEDFNIINCASIMRLSTGGGIEHGLVENDPGF